VRQAPPARTYELDDIALRLVVYRSGFKSGHWCNKGHVVCVLSGIFVIEHEDETRTELSATKSWDAADDARSPHRVLCESGATDFILD
jgi:hypothetical protein